MLHIVTPVTAVSNYEVLPTVILCCYSSYRSVTNNRSYNGRQLKKQINKLPNKQANTNNNEQGSVRKSNSSND